MSAEDIREFIASIDISKATGRVRLISYLSAIIAVCHAETSKQVFTILKASKFDQKAIYETILQSYLFLGFPRMIEAAVAFNEAGGAPTDEYESSFGKISPYESKKWFENGVGLCKQVYGRNYERLKERFRTISPEMFRWMVIEGYGKVLTRPGLSSIERELAEVAALIVDQRERQLISHIIGSLNVGAPVGLIRQVNKDIRPLAGEAAFNTVTKIINDVEARYETP